MKKENIYKILYAASVLLIIAFVIISGVDYYLYNTTLNSAPYYVFILARAAEFLIPSIVVFIIGRAVKKKYKK